jgi:transcriptional regulator with XRE-family HTH domain
MIGKRLSQIISESALKKQDAAAMIGVSPGTISNWIKNKDFQNNSNFFRLCKLAGWNSDWILTGQGDKFEKNSNVLNEPTSNYSNERMLRLEGKVELLEKQLKERDEYIRELLEICDKKNIKRGARSG